MVFPYNKDFKLLRCSLSILCAGIFSVASPVAAKPALVALIKSAQRPEYEQTSKAIISSLEKAGSELDVEEIFFHNNSRQDNIFWNKVLEKKPELIITMGTPATRSAISIVENIPIVFTVVLDNIDDPTKKVGSSDIWGVTLAIPVKEQLEMMKKALPDIRRVGFIYSSSSAYMYQNAKEISARMGLRLVASEIASERDIPSVLRRTIPEVDVLWMPPDAVIYERSILRFILLECYKNSVPIMAVSKRIAMAGTPLALGVDYEDIGRQTAELVLKRLSGRFSVKPVIENPNKLFLYINKGVATSLGLKIPQRVIEQAIPVESWR